MAYSELPAFPPPPSAYETPDFLHALGDARAYLGELKGLAQSIPNERILISTLGLQEAQSSSEIENIVTTQQALHEYRLRPGDKDAATKEAAQYAVAMEAGWRDMQKTGLMACNTIIHIQKVLMGRDTGWRTLPGTVLKNNAGETIFTPPPPEQVPQLMAALEEYMHNDEGAHPLVRMALTHHRFETIHPFYDGNGRTGRIINILFLVKAGLLNAPVLYLSRYINQTRGEYYRLLQQVRKDGDWEAWLLYMLRGTAATARHTITLVEKIRALHSAHKKSIQGKRFYSRDLLDALFTHTYTKASLLAKELKVSRVTAVRYLDTLAADGILMKTKVGRETYYGNIELSNLLFNMPEIDL